MVDKLKVEFEIDAKQAERAIKQLSGRTDKFSKDARKNFGNASQAFNVFKGSLAATAVIGSFRALTRTVTNGISSMVSEAIKIEQISTQFETLTGSAASAAEVIRDLQEFSASTPFQFGDVARAGKQLLGFQFGVEEIIPRLQALGDVAAGSGAQLSELTLIFGQVRAAGKLTGERLLQLQERAIPIGPALAKSMNVAESSIKDLVSKGGVSFAQFEKAFLSLSEKGGQFFQGMVRQSKTLGGVLSTMSDNFALVSNDIGQLFLPVLKEGAIAVINFIQEVRKSKKFNDFLRDSFIALTEIWNKFVDVVKSTRQFLESNSESFQKVGEVISSVATTFIDFTSIVASGIAQLAKLDTVVRLVDVALDLIAAPLKFFKNIMEILKGVIDGNISAAEAFALTLRSGLALVITRMLAPIRALIKGLSALASVISTDMESTLDNAEKTLSDFGDGLEDNAEKAIKQATALGKASDALNEQVKSQIKLNNAVADGSAASESARISNDERILALEKMGVLQDQLVTKTKEGGLQIVDAEKSTLEALATLRQEARDRRLEEKDLEKENKALENEEALEVLTAALGEEEALRQIFRNLSIKQEKKKNKELSSLGKKKQGEDIKNILSFQKFEQLKNSQRISNFSSTLKTIAELQKSTSKELFFVGKAAAIAESVVQGFLAVQKALASLPFPANIGAAAAVGIVAAKNTAAISGANIKGFQEGGFVRSGGRTGDTTLIRANRDELILNRRDQSTLFSAIQTGNLGTNDEQLSDLTSAILNQPIVIEINEREIARATRDASLSGFGIVA
jgi:tape measure domain-containing protein